MIDHVCYVSLLQAILVQWLKDAQRSGDDLVQLAAFLDVSPDTVGRLAN